MERRIVERQERDVRRAKFPFVNLVRNDAVRIGVLGNQILGIRREAGEKRRIGSDLDADASRISAQNLVQRGKDLCSVRTAVQCAKKMVTGA